MNTAQTRTFTACTIARSRIICRLCSSNTTARSARIFAAAASSAAAFAAAAARTAAAAAAASARLTAAASATARSTAAFFRARAAALATTRHPRKLRACRGG